MFYVVSRRRGPDYNASLPLEEQSDWIRHADFMDGLVASGFVVLVLIDGNTGSAFWLVAGLVALGWIACIWVGSRARGLLER